MNEVHAEPIVDSYEDADGVTQPTELKKAPLPLTPREQAWAEYEQRRQEANDTMDRLMMGIRGKDRWLFNRAADYLGPHVALRFVYDSPTIRSAAWTTCFYYYVARVQITIMVFVVMMVAPPLISNDLRGRSFLIYFSSAITRRDYILGKLAVVMFIIALVTVLPGIALYAVSIAFAPSLGALVDTFGVVVRMTLLILVIGIPASLGALYLSARTTHPRFAAFTWVACWAMGAIFYVAIVSTVGERSVLGDWSYLLSPFHLTTMLTEWVFGVRSQLDAIGASRFLTDRLPEAGFAIRGLVFVLLLSLLAVIGIRRRITAPISV